MTEILTVKHVAVAAYGGFGNQSVEPGQLLYHSRFVRIEHSISVSGDDLEDGHCTEGEPHVGTLGEGIYYIEQEMWAYDVYAHRHLR